MKFFLFLSVLSFAWCKYSRGQIVCILCYDQNDSISSGVNNLLLNGGFENGCQAYWHFCPASANYTCDLTNWTCTGGGPSTYAQIFDASSSQVVEGTKVVYFGSSYCHACSPTTDDTSCLTNLDCTVMDIPNGYPQNTSDYGGTTGVSLEQTVTGLIVGNTYVLEFWAGGEDFYSFPSKGLFAVDVGFGDTLLRDKRTGPGKIGTTYIIEFNAAASAHTIKFTNWGHICSNCTELVIDNARLYTIAELSSSVPTCSAVTSGTSFAASDTTVCEKFCVDFNDFSTNNPTAWHWQFPGGNPSSSILQNPSNICYNLPGTYDVTLTITNVNGDDTLTLDNYITVYPTPAIPTITQVGYTLTSSPASSYQWQLNTVNIPGATNQSYAILQSGYYTVIVGDFNGCKNSFTQYVLISGINNVMLDANISVYPNPSSGTFVVDLANEVSTEEVSIDLMNMLGQKVFSTREKFLSADYKKQIDLSEVARGFYFIEVKSERYFVRKRILIQ